MADNLKRKFDKLIKNQNTAEEKKWKSYARFKKIKAQRKEKEVNFE